MLKYALAAALSLAVVSTVLPAHAADLTVQLKEIDGKDVMDPATNRPVDMSLSKICINALLGTYPDEQVTPPPPEEKLKRWRLAIRIQENPKDVALSVEDIGRLKNLIGKAFPPLIMGQAFALLDPAAPKN